MTLNLKNEIERAKRNNENIKKVKSNINNVIVRGGGIQSNTLAEIPNNIKNMLDKNYKKVAILNSKYDLDKNYKPGTNFFKIPLNLSFQPTFLMICLKQGNTELLTINSLTNYNSFTGVSSANVNWYIKGIQKTYFELGAENFNSWQWSISHIVAIE